MPFDAVILGYVEDALAESFGYHRGLDAFVVRSGIPSKYLEAARAQAEARAQQRSGGSRNTGRAPKRYVAQELLIELGRRGDEGDRLIANLITAFTRGVFQEASQKGRAATDLLRAQIETDRQLRRQEEEREAAEARRQQADEVRLRQQRREAVEAQRRALRQNFIDLSAMSDEQARGYAFEGFLTNLFEFEGLQPRGSFRNVGEQIDGSFMWRSGTHLVEAKWIQGRVAGKEFGAFTYKVEGKTADTRGLFIAINGYAEPAIQGLNAKGALRFVCVDGAHIVRAFEPGWSLVRILEVVWRHADETGEAYLPVARFSS